MNKRRIWYSVTLLLAILLVASTMLVSAQAENQAQASNTNQASTSEESVMSPDAFNIPGNYTIGGNLGIGTEGPQRKLHIVTTTSSGGAILIANSTANAPASEASIGFTDTDGPLWAAGVGGFNTPNSFFIGSTNGPKLFIDQSSIALGVVDVKILPGPRGDGGRAIVQDINDTLVLNYGGATANGDFAGGTRIDSNLTVMGDASVRSLQIRNGIGGNLTIGGPDLAIGPSGRGDGGRAIVHENNDTLVLNYVGDFAGGTRIDSNLTVNGDASVRSLQIHNGIGGNLTIGGPDLAIGPSGRGDGGRAIVHENDDTLVLNYVGDFAGGTRIDSNLTIGGPDFVIGPSERGDGGRAIVHENDNTLVLNYGGGTANGDFAGGTRIDSNLTVMGDASVRSLQIRGGADLAEPFYMSDHAKVEPGMVVAIDPDHPGQLRLAQTPYDRMVAGVVSGAGGVNSGLLMQQEGTAADGEHPVALTGRVYVWVDATHHPVNPGDLLTTSDTPGHAAKVTDYTRAQGAILGKAMNKLEKGKGLVLTLVTLQ